MVNMPALKSYTGLKSMYKPAANRVKKASPNDIIVMYLGKQPTKAKKSKPIKNPINKAHLIESYPCVNDNFVPNYY